MPRATSNRPRLEAVSPLPKLEATPPVTKRCFVTCAWPMEDKPIIYLRAAPTPSAIAVQWRVLVR
jgi:hypothetical protein